MQRPVIASIRVQTENRSQTVELTRPARGHSKKVCAIRHQSALRPVAVAGQCVYSETMQQLKTTAIGIYFINSPKAVRAALLGDSIQRRANQQRRSGGIDAVIGVAMAARRKHFEK